jgi:hypothetical protein
MIGAGVGDGVGVDDVGVMSWLIPGISESRRLNVLEPLALPDGDEPPDAAAVSPVPPDEVLLDIAEIDDEPTAYAEVEAADETVARLLCCVLLVVVDKAPDVVG